ncbi:uncharacterized protein LOC119091028 [Pollicipes pollicipes]|uniref:uncharacterized protein LOC119091028 n=1 Tax=Pollicipes pollicipes TaxID=41117 RepID=UPI001884C563|nr:uncharacterized protein LOC119091028 [Pollicipes pollicipes]
MASDAELAAAEEPKTEQPGTEEEPKTEQPDAEEEPKTEQPKADELKAEEEPLKEEQPDVKAQPKEDEMDGEEPSEEDAATESGENKIVISLGELVDLALCTPEPGAVNFNLLRSVLHALVQRLDLVDIKADILDEDTSQVFAQIVSDHAAPPPVDGKLPSVVTCYGSQLENAEKLGLKDLRPLTRHRTPTGEPGAGLSSSDSIGLSSGSDSETGERRRHSRRGTLSEVAEQRLRQSGRQSAVSIGSGVEGSAVLADYTSLDKLQKKLGEVEEKLDVLDMAEMLPKLREFQQALSGSQEDVQGLWQSLQLMKKVDANEEGIDKLTGIIEHTMSKLKKVKKHTDRLDKQLSELLGMAGEKGEKPVSLADMETKYVEIKNVIAGLMGVTQEDGMPAASSDDLRSLGAGIVTWSGLEGALEDVKGDLKAMDQLSDETLKAVEQQQTEARQQELIEQGGDASNSETKAKRLLAHLSELLDKHKILEKRVSQMEAALGDNFSDKVIEQLTLLKASASQIQELRMKLSMTEKEQSGGWSDLDVVAEGSLHRQGSSSQGSFVGPSLSLNLTSLREPSQMDLNHLTDWLNYNKARMEQLEKALVSQSEQVRDFGDRLGDQVVSFRDKLERVERELAGMLGRLSSAANKPGMTREDAAALHDAYAKIQALQMDVESLSAVSKKIVDDRGQIDDELAMLIRALEELKECKVDRATLDELIETKADRSSVEKKVSSWQFEQACQELSEGLGSMLEKMGSQETDWIRSVDEIHATCTKAGPRGAWRQLRRYINSTAQGTSWPSLNRLIARR